MSWPMVGHIFLALYLCSSTQLIVAASSGQDAESSTAVVEVIRSNLSSRTDSVEQMIMAVLGIDNGTNSKVLSRDNKEQSSYLVKKLMEGSLVVTEPLRESGINSSNSSSAGEAKRLFSTEQPAPLSGGVYPEVAPPKQVVGQQQQKECRWNGQLFAHNDKIGSSHPCEQCSCHNGDVSCFWQQCEGSPAVDCVPLFVPGSCCPVYSCKKP